MEQNEVLITPELAAEMLKKNRHNNRKLDKRNKGKLINDILADQWMPETGETIKIDWDGVLLDGQHRLQAVVETQKAVTMTVVTGLNPEVYPYLDSGKRRTVPDVFHSKGRTSTVLRAAIVRVLMMWEKTEKAPWSSISSTGLLSDISIEKWEEQYVEELNYALVFTKHLKKEKVNMPASSFGAFCFMVNKNSPNAYRLEEFLEGYIDGVGLSKNDPRLALRRIDFRVRSLRGVRAQQAGVSVLIRAWNDWLDSTSITGSYHTTIKATIPFEKLK